MIARSLSVIAFALAGLVFFGTPSIACSCAHMPSEVGAVADVVFSGIARAYSTEDRVARFVVVEFQVGSVYKGTAAARVQVQALGGRARSGGLGPGCEYGFQLGRQYTVFAIDHDADGLLNTNGCFWNVEGPISPATYGLPPGKAPAHGDEVVQLSIIAAVAVIALGAISMARRPRPLSP